jgi:hypothetical protein
MVDVEVDVEDPVELFAQLVDGQHDVVHVAESGRLGSMARIKYFRRKIAKNGDFGAKCCFSWPLKML